MNSDELNAAITAAFQRLPASGAVRLYAGLLIAEYNRDAMAAQVLDRGLARSLVFAYRRQLLRQLTALERQMARAVGKGVQDA